MSAPQRCVRILPLGRAHITIKEVIYMRCPRCDGLMVHAWAYDSFACIAIQVLRCVQCGEYLDEVIEKNRMSPHPLTGKRARLPGG